VGATRGIDAGFGQSKAFDGDSVNEVGLHDLFHVRRLDEAVPDALRIDDDRGTVFALIKAAGLVDPDVGVQPRLLTTCLEGLPNGDRVATTTAAARVAFRPFVGADKYVSFE
jgi:hypothetical protein